MKLVMQQEYAMETKLGGVLLPGAPNFVWLYTLIFPKSYIFYESGRPYDVQKSSRQGLYDLVTLDHDSYA